MRTETSSDQAASAAENKEGFPLSAAQTRCWVLDQISPGTPALNVALRWELRGKIQSADLERAFHAVIARHEILRTCFVLQDEGPVQQIAPAAPFKLAVVDIRTLPGSAQKDHVETIAHDLAEQPFDLQTPGLIRATLVRLSPDLAQLLIVVHQSCFDGTSIRLLGREIGAFAQGYAEDRAPDVPPLDLQYADYALWQQACFEESGLLEDRRFWRETLSGAPYFEVPPDHARPRHKSAQVAQIRRDLPPATGARIGPAAQAMGVSQFTFGAGLWAACLHRVTGRTDILFATQVAGRTEEDLAPLIGVFINNLVLRFSVSPDASLTETIAGAKPVVEAALAHQDLPFNHLVHMLNPPRDPARAPLISVTFTLQRVFLERRQYGAVTLTPLPSHLPGSIYDLDLAILERPEGWELTLAYNPDLFEPATADALSEAMVQALTLATQDPAASGAAPRLSDLPGLPRPGTGPHEAESAGHLLPERSGPDPQEPASHPRQQDPVQPAAALKIPSLQPQKQTGQFHPPQSQTAHSAQSAPAVTDHAAPNRTGAPAPDHTDPSATAQRVLADDPRISEACVVGTADGPYAYVTPHPGRLEPLEHLPSELLETGPPALAALSGLSVLHHLPKDARGRVDTARLPPPRGPALERSRKADALETLRQDWQDILGLDHVPDDGHFFALGGHSVLALRSVARMRNRGDTALTIADFFETPRLDALAQKLRMPAAPSTTRTGRILRISHGGMGHPLIAINNAATAMALDSRHARPIACVGMFGEGDEHEIPTAPFETIAARYAALIRQAQPQGPYLLYGNCVHGNLALEAARHLQSAGATITGVVMKDVWEPGYTQALQADPRRRRAEKLHSLRIRLAAVRSAEMSLSAFLGLYRITRNSGVLQLARALGLITRVRRSDLDARQEAFVSALSALRDRYRPKPVDFPVLHLVTDITPKGPQFNPSIGWEDIVAPDKLTTLHLKKVLIQQNEHIGIDALAEAIAHFADSRPRASGPPNPPRPDAALRPPADF